MKIQNYLEVLDYKISDGSKFLWNCFGENCYILTWRETEYDWEYTSSVYFDTITKEVYMMELFDEKENKCHYWLNSKFIDAYEQDCIRRGVSRVPKGYEDLLYFHSDIFLLELIRTKNKVFH